jgi:hypothetical protein
VRRSRSYDGGEGLDDPKQVKLGAKLIGQPAGRIEDLFGVFRPIERHEDAQRAVHGPRAPHRGRNEQDWNVRASHKLIGDATVPPPRQPRAATGRDNDQIGSALADRVENGIGRRHPAEAIPLEIDFGHDAIGLTAGSGCL